MLRDLDEEYKKCEELLNEIGKGRMETPGVAGFWSVKDIVGHITSWRRRTVQRLQAVAKSEDAPPPPWPADLKDDDSINAWFYERERAKSVEQVLNDSRQVFQELRAAIDALPEDTLADPRRFPWLEGKPLTAVLLFSHFHEEHEPGMRTWLARQEASEA